MTRRTAMVAIRSVVLIVGFVGSFQAKCDEPGWAHATLSGGGVTSDFTLFDQKLKEVLGDTNLGAHRIGCNPCDETSWTLKLQPLPEKITYTFPLQLYMFVVFEEAWLSAQKAGANKAFAIQFDHDTPAPTCGTRPAQCTPMYFCSSHCGVSGDGCASPCSP